MEVQLNQWGEWSGVVSVVASLSAFFFSASYLWVAPRGGRGGGGVRRLVTRVFGAGGAIVSMGGGAYALFVRRAADGRRIAIGVAISLLATGSILVVVISIVSAIVS